MKVCPSCRLSNDDAVECCRECGAKLSFTSSEDIDVANENAGALVPSRDFRVRLIYGAWIIAAIFMSPLLFTSGFIALIFAPNFPIGLFAFFGGANNSFNFLVGWALYCGIVTILVFARKQGVFIFFYVVLCVLLVMDVVGCYKAISTILNGLH